LQLFVVEAYLQQAAGVGVERDDLADDH